MNNPKPNRKKSNWPQTDVEATVGFPSNRLLTKSSVGGFLKKTRSGLEIIKL